MTDDLREIVLGVLAAGVTAALGWFARTYLWRRRQRRVQTFFGLPAHAQCLLVVNRDPGTHERAVARLDVFALLELSGLIKDCGAQADVVAHDEVRQGFGERTEFCIGGPASNLRTAAHLRSLLPGVTVETEPGPDQTMFTIGGERYRMQYGVAEYVLLARLTAGPGRDATGDRPVFLCCGQRSVTNQAAARYLARNHRRLARRHGSGGGFCLLLRVVDSAAYGPDVVELVADVTRAARTSPPDRISAPAQRSDASA